MPKQNLRSHVGGALVAYPARRGIVTNVAPIEWPCCGTFSRASSYRGTRCRSGSTLERRMRLSDRFERISHDKIDTLHRLTHRRRICCIAIRGKRSNLGNGRTKQHAQHPRSAGAARHDWKFRAEGRDSDGAVGRNVHSALGRRDQFGPHLEQHEPSCQVATAPGGCLTPRGRVPCGRAPRPAARAYRGVLARRKAARSA